MMNKKFSFIQTFLISGIIVFSGFFFSCEVGLGSAVDTETPKVAVTYPPANAAVRDSFVLAGTCSDDQKVSSVSVTLTNTTINKSFGPYKKSFTYIEDSKTWSQNLNKYDATNSSYYNGWELPDGQYSATVIAEDTAGRQSGEITYAFEIDNTPPVLILKSPASVSLESPTAYGANFKINGTIAEDHTVKTMAVTVYGADGTAVLANTDSSPYTASNVETAGGTSVSILKYLNGGTSELNNRYNTIYAAGDTSSDTRSYMCSITLVDNAKQYKDSSESTNATTGNSVNVFYLSDSVKSTMDSYGLEASDIKKIINGTYTGDVTSENQSAIKLLFKDSEKSKAAFSLNPDASPKYSVTGYKFTEIKGSASSVSYITDNNASANQKVTVVATAGRDGTYVNPSTLMVYLFGPFGSSDLDSDTLSDIYNDPANYAGYTDSSTEYYDSTTGILTNGKGFVLKNENSTENSPVFTNSSYTSGTVETYTYPVYLYSKIINNNYYILSVTGQDADEVELTPEDDSFYGFTGSVAGTAPTVAWDAYNSSSANSNISDLGYINSSALTFSGTATSKSSTIASVAYVVTVTDESATGSSSTTIQTISGLATLGSEASSNTTWSFNFADGSGYSAIESGKEWFYAITLTIKDENGNSYSPTKRVHVDTVKPVVEITSVTPTVSKNSTTYVNGIINVKASVTETNLSASSYSVYVADNVVENLNNIELKGYSPSFTLDTTALTDDSVIKIVVTTKDKAGNVGSVSTVDYNNTYNGLHSDIKIDQDTDIPVINLTNSDSALTDAAKIKEACVANAEKTNIFGKTSNNKLTATITDDDGISSITVAVTGTKSDGTSYSKDKTVLSNGSSTSYPLSYTLPDSYGEYTAVINVVDTTGTQTAYTHSSQSVFVVVDDGTPTFSNVSPTDNGYYSSTISVSGKVTDENGGITLQHTSSSEASGSYTSSQSITSGSVFNDTLTISGDDGSHTALYTATDKYGQTSTYSIIYNKDTTAPVIYSVTTDPAASGSWINNAAPTISVLVKDPTDSSGNCSGLDTVKYSLSVNGGSASSNVLTQTADKNADGYYTYSGTLNLGEGVNTVTVTATDKATNSLTSSSYTFKVDAQSPVITLPDSSSYDSKINNSDYSSMATDGVAIVPTILDSGSGAVKAWLSTDATASDTYSASTTISGVTLGTATTTSWQPSLKIEKAKLATDGVYTFYVLAEDASNRISVSSAITITVDTAAPTLSITNADLADNAVITETNSYITESSGTYSYSIRGKWSDNVSGTAHLYYSTDSTTIGSVTWTELTDAPKVTTAASWEYPISDVAEQSGYNIAFYAIDEFENTTDVKSFSGITFDFSAPTIVLTESSQATYINNKYTLTGVVTDTRAMSTTSPYGISVTATLNGVDAAAAISSHTVYSPETEGKSYKFVTTIPVSASPAYDGTWNFTVNATDAAGRSATECSATILIDTRSPTGLSNTNNSSWRNDSTTQSLEVHVSDSYDTANSESLATGAYSGLSTATYTVSGATTKDATNLANAGTYSSNTAYTTYTSTLSLNQGKNTVVVSATDYAGNTVSNLATLAYNVDTIAPVLSGVSAAKTKITKTDAASGILINATSTDAVSGTKKIWISKSGSVDGAVSALDTETQTTATTSAWSPSTLAIPATAFQTSGAYVDGNYTFYVHAIDDAGNESVSSALTFTLDTVAPTLTVSNLIINNVYTESDVTNLDSTVSPRSAIYKVSGTWFDATSGTSLLQYTTSSTPSSVTEVSTATTTAGKAEDAKTKWVTVSGTTAAANVNLSWTASIVVYESSENTISFRAIDAYGNATTPASGTTSFNGITFDFSIPTITNNSSITTPTNNNVSFVETVADKLAVSSSGISVTVTQNGATPTGAYTINKDSATAATSIPVTVTVNADKTSHTTDGNWIIKIQATDDSGRSDGTVTKSFTLDTISPTINDTKSTVGDTSTAALIGADSKWYNSITQKISGQYDDNNSNSSGVATIYYWVGSPETAADETTIKAIDNVASVVPTEDSSKSYYYNFSGTSSTLVAGTNYLRVAAVDEAGNVSSVSSYIVKVDVDNPEISTDSKFTDNSILSNGEESVTLYGLATDLSSGVKSVSVKIGNYTVSSGETYSDTSDKRYGSSLVLSTSGSGTISGAAETYSDKNTLWTLTASSSWLKTLTNTVSVNATVTDVAGTSSTQTVCYLEIDTTAPTVTFKTPSSGSTVNKTCTITGTASDTRKLATGTGAGKLYVKKEGGSYPDTGASVDIESDGTWTATFDTFTSDYYNSTDTGSITMYLIVKDEAGNSSSSSATRTFAVDQSTDRPDIKITSIESNGATLMYGTNASISGTISDDDSSDSAIVGTFIATSSQVMAASAVTQVTAAEEIPVVYYDTDNKKYAINNIPVTPSSTAVFYKRAVAGTYTNPDATTEDLTGYDITQFDPTTGDFMFIPYNTVDGTKNIYFYIIDNADTTVTGDTGTTFYSLNTASSLNRPYVQFKSATKTDNNSIISYVSDSESPSITSTKVSYGDDDNASDTTDATIESSLILGGKTARYAKFTAVASDASGIAKIDISATDGTKTYSETGSNLTTFTTVVVDLSTWTTGSVTVTVKATDNSGLYSNSTRTFVLDNSAPSVTMTSPLTSDEVTGSVTVSGTTSDEGNAGVTYIGWAIPTTTQAALTDSSSVVTDASYASADEYLSNVLAWQNTMPSGKSNFIWEFDFDGSNATTNPSFATYSSSTYCSTISSGVYTIPIYFKALDKNNNLIIKRTFIKYNKDADKPTASITYPSSTDYDTGKTYVTLGGTVRASGIATDNVSVSKVYYQIDWDGDGVFDDYNSTKTTRDDQYAANSGCYSVETYSDAGIASGWTDTSTEVTEAEKIAWWGIKATNAASWSATLNSNKELNATSDLYYGSTTNLRLINIRACAIDNNNKVGGWSEPVSIMIDDNAPEIGQASLYQYASTVTTATAASTATPIASKTYTSGMYLTGQWYLSMTVLDESGIKTWYAYEGSTKMTGDSVAATAETSDGKTGYTLYIKVSTTDGSSSYSIEASDDSSSSSSSSAKYSLNKDNTAPTIGTLYGNGTTITNSTPVTNSSYRYALSGDITDGDSGFEKLAFYFLRDADTDRVYDPMIEYNKTYDSTANYTTANSYAHSRTNTADLTSQTTANSLVFWGYNGSTGSTTTGTYTPSTATAENITGNSHIRKGGLIYIGGAYRTISAIDSSTGAIEFTPALPSALASVTPFFPYAQVVDNTAAESRDKWSDKTSTIKGDDGDGMVESVIKSGTTWSWDGSVYSDNMPDGPITIVCVAFDTAGNIAATSVTTTIQNNAPRLAKVYLGTDLDDNDMYGKKEIVKYNILEVAGEEQSDITIATGSSDYSKSRTPFTIKNGMAVIPEFTGGNGEIQMIFQRDAATNSGTQKLNGTNTEGLYSSATTYLEPEMITTVSNGLAETTNTYGAYVLANDIISGKTGTISETNNDDGSGKTMSFTFWDSTEETTPGSTSNSCILTVSDFIEDLLDDTKPKGFINPFYWNSITDNSIYGSTTTTDDFSKLNGHIELEADWAKTAAYSGYSTSDSAYYNKAQYDDDPKVSGQIKIEGYAYDETRLGSISVKFAGIDLGSGTGVANAMATYSSGTWTTVSQSVATDGYSFTVEDVSIGQTGHAAKWTLNVDTSKIEDVAGTEKVIYVTVKDASENDTSTLTASTTQTTTKTVYATDDEAALYHFYSTAEAANAAKDTYSTDTNYATGLPSSTLFTLGSADATYTTVYAYTYSAEPYYKVDVVPYINKIKTSNSKLKSNNSSVYDRTSGGHYPESSASTLYVQGFNLASGAAVTTSLVTSGTAPTLGTGTYNAESYYTIAMSDVASGELSVSVNGVSTLNNINKNDSCGSYSIPDGTEIGATGSNTVYKNYYNRQPNGDNNNLLTDDLYLDIWSLDSDVAKVKQAGYIVEPIMKINPSNGTVGFAFNNGPAYFSMANGTSTSFSLWQRNYARNTTTGFAIDSNGASHGITVGLDTNPNGENASEVAVGHAGRMTYMYSGWGIGDTTGQDGNYNGYRTSRIESIGVPSGTYNDIAYTSSVFLEDRFHSPSLTTAVHSDGTYVYLAYYDDLNQQIRFRYGNLANAAYDSYARDSNNNIIKDSDGNGYKRGYTFDKIADQTDSAIVSVGNTNVVFESDSQYYSVPASSSVVYATGEHAYAGEYVSIAVIPYSTASEDVVVMTWYDATESCWWYSYKLNPCNNNSMSTDHTDGNWSTPVLIQDDAGEHCKIAVDAKGGVHLAAYDINNANLLYAYLSSYIDTTPSVSVVDSYGITGTDITLDVAISADGKYVVPYIGYYMTSIAKPKFATLPGVIPVDSTAAAAITIPSGASDDAFTQNWEVSVLPTSSRLRDDYINVGVWKDTEGKIKASTYTAANSQSGDTGYCYGNGTSYPIMGYAIRVGTTGYIETAQRR